MYLNINLLFAEQYKEQYNTLSNDVLILQTAWMLLLQRHQYNSISFCDIA